MDYKKQMNVHSRARSFSFAINGIWLMFKNEPNVWIHAIATIAVIILGFVRHISPAQWGLIAIAVSLVWITEAINTCIEKLCDFCCDNKWHPAIKTIKDISAAAVLIAAITSVIIALTVFIF